MAVKKEASNMERYFQITESGHNIRCKLYCNDPRNFQKAVIFVHGFGGHKDNRAAARFAEKMLGKVKNTALITFDLPCHGDDVKKKLSLSDCAVYLDLVFSYVQKTYQPEALYAYATSFGAYLTLKYLQEQGNPFRKIVLRSPAVNIYDSLTTIIMTPENREKLEKGKDALVGFDRKVTITAQYLEELKACDIRKMDFLDFAEDILILHGTEDEVIPFSESHDFAEEQLMEFIPIEGADHRYRDVKKMDLAIKYILEFFF